MSDKNTGASFVQDSKESQDDDPIIAKLKKTGCLEKHYSVLVIYLFVLLFYETYSLFSINRNVWPRLMIGENVKRSSKSSEIVS
jgi:hypothetical protein